MDIYRVVAVNRECGNNYNFLCGITDSGELEDGEWFGYYAEKDIVYPFVLKYGEYFFYGGDGDHFEATNIGSNIIKKNELFTVYSTEGLDVIYEITSISLI
jgi:hypothetical protein